MLNLSRSKLCFDVNLSAAGGNNFNLLYGNALSLIDRITLTSRSGVILADIPYTGHFGALVSSTNTKSSELMMRSALPMNNVNAIQATATCTTSTAQAAANAGAGTAVPLSALTAQVSSSWTNITLPDSLAAAQRYPVGDLICCNLTNNN